MAARAIRAACREASGCRVVGVPRGRRWAKGARKAGGRPGEGAYLGGGASTGRTCVRSPRPPQRSPVLAAVT